MHAQAQMDLRARAHAAFGRFAADPVHAPVLARLQADLGLSAAVIEAGFLRYTCDSFVSANDIYAEAVIHIAMWIEYQTHGGIHARRQSAVLDALWRYRPAAIADIGYGAPTRYVYDYVLATPGVRVLLCDKFPAALAVGQSLLRGTNPSAHDRVDFARHDMDADPVLVGHDCYLLLDAIEHTAEPGRYLRQTVAVAAPQALFLLHIPIGPLIASHAIAWPSAAAATVWLADAGLEVLSSEVITPDPAVDLFAQQQDESAMTDLFVVARTCRG